MTAQSTGTDCRANIRHNRPGIWQRIRQLPWPLRLALMMAGAGLLLGGVAFGRYLLVFDEAVGRLGVRTDSPELVSAFYRLRHNRRPRRRSGERFEREAGDD